jgi:hypothetical protein
MVLHHALARGGDGADLADEPHEVAGKGRLDVRVFRRGRKHVQIAVKDHFATWFGKEPSARRSD